MFPVYRSPRKVFHVLRAIRSYQAFRKLIGYWFFYAGSPPRQLRLALNWLSRDRPRLYSPLAVTPYIHPTLTSYHTDPAVHYTLYPLADICHFWYGVPDWNRKPFVVECEHVLALAGNISDWQHGLQRTELVQATIGSDLCRVCLTYSKGLIRHSLRYITDPSLHRKFDYLYESYPSQPERLVDVSGPFTILTIATRFYDKGVPIALKVFDILHQRYPGQVRMWLVCDAVPLGYPIPDGVTLYTDRPLSDTKKARLYGHSHVLFLPVLSDSFGCFPEAYAYGTPVVTTRIHHGEETVRPGITGFLVDPPFYSYSDGYGTTWKTWEDFVSDCRTSFERGAFDKLIEQCVDYLDQMIRGDVDLQAMSRAAQAFHREVFSPEVRNRKLRQIYQRVALSGSRSADGDPNLI